MSSTNAVQPGLAQPYGSPQSRAALRLDDGLFIAVGLSWGSGLIHAQAAFGQAGKYVPFAIALALLAAVQFAWGAAVYRWPTRWLIGAGAALSFGAIAVWVASRTSGLPLGPKPWQHSPVGPTGALLCFLGRSPTAGSPTVLATADEALLCFFALAVLQGRRARFAPRAVKLAAAAVGVALLSLSSLTFMLSGHAH